MLLMSFFQRSSKYTPYCALFCRHPRNPGILNIARREEDYNSIVVSDVTEEHQDVKTREVADLHAEVRVKWQYMDLKNSLKYINMF